MPYAANGAISTDVIAGGIEISEQQYADALGAMISGKIISIEGGFNFVNPPTPEDMENPVVPEDPLSLPITKRQLRLTLVRNGIAISGVEAAISAMPEGLAKEEAQIEWADTSSFTRTHPTLLLIAAALGLTQERIDVMWKEAVTA